MRLEDKKIKYSKMTQTSEDTKKKKKKSNTKLDRPRMY